MKKTPVGYRTERFVHDGKIHAISIPESNNPLVNLMNRRFIRDMDVPGMAGKRQVRAAQIEVPMGRGKKITLALPVGMKSEAQWTKFHIDEYKRIYEDMKPEVRKWLEENDKSADWRGNKWTETMKQSYDGLLAAASMGTVYLKPSYALPQLLGQGYLLAVQHHFNPFELAKSASQLKWLMDDPEIGKLILGGTGTGISKALLFEKGAYNVPGAKHSIAAQRAMGEFWSWAIDKPERAMAFLYEARRDGFTTPEKLRELLLADPNPVGKAVGDLATRGHAQKLVDARNAIFSRANREMIDYANMRPWERNILRRIIFFYPFMRGATTYSYRQMKEHPISTAFQYQAGTVEDKQAQKDLGLRPSFVRQAGVTKVGETVVPGLGKVPTVVNPQSAAIVSSGAQVTGTAAGLLGASDVTSVTTPLALGNPLVQGVVAAATRRDPFTGEQLPPSESGLQAFWDQLVGPLAGYRLWEQATTPEESRKERIYPVSALDAFVSWGVGRAVNPTPYNKNKAQEVAVAERRSILSKADRQEAKWADFRKNLAQRAGVSLLPQSIVDLVDMNLARQQNYIAQKITSSQVGGVDGMRRRIQADVELLVDWDRMPETAIEAYKQYLPTLNYSQLQDMVSTITAMFGYENLSGYLSSQNARHPDLAPLRMPRS